MNEGTPTCSVCNWTNAASNLNLNVGDPGDEPKWMCHGCLKRAVDELVALRLKCDGLAGLLARRGFCICPKCEPHTTPQLTEAVAVARNTRDGLKVSRLALERVLEIAEQIIVANPGSESIEKLAQIHCLLNNADQATRGIFLG